MSYDEIEHADNPVETATPGLGDEDREAIEEERARRLDPANRPDKAEVDNSGVELPTVQAFAAQADDDAEGTAGTADPSQAFREMEISEEERREIAEERERRLDPANRPDNAEVDNTGRPMEDGRFTD